MMTDVLTMIADGLVPPDEVEIETLAAVSKMEVRIIIRLPIKQIRECGFEPLRCFSNVARIQNGTPKFGWMTNIGEEAYVLHSVTEIKSEIGKYLLCVTPPFDWFDEVTCEFILDDELVPAYDGPDNSFNGCDRRGVRVPRMLRKNFPSSRYFFERLGVYITHGMSVDMAHQLASEDANERDGKPMQIIRSG